MWKGIKNLWEDFSLGEMEISKKSESWKTLFHRSARRIVKCTVADDNGWVTDCVFIQRRNGWKINAQSILEDFLRTTTLCVLDLERCCLMIQLRKFSARNYEAKLWTAIRHHNTEQNEKESESENQPRKFILTAKARGENFATGRNPYLSSRNWKWNVYISFSTRSPSSRYL